MLRITQPVACIFRVPCRPPPWDGQTVKIPGRVACRSVETIALDFASRIQLTISSRKSTKNQPDFPYGHRFASPEPSALVDTLRLLIASAVARPQLAVHSDQTCGRLTAGAGHPEFHPDNIGGFATRSAVVRCGRSPPKSSAMIGGRSRYGFLQGGKRNVGVAEQELHATTQDALAIAYHGNQIGTQTG